MYIHTRRLSREPTTRGSLHAPFSQTRNTKETIVERDPSGDHLADGEWTWGDTETSLGRQRVGRVGTVIFRESREFVTESRESRTMCHAGVKRHGTRKWPRTVAWARVPVHDNVHKQWELSRGYQHDGPGRGSDPGTGTWPRTCTGTRVIFHIGRTEMSQCAMRIFVEGANTVVPLHLCRGSPDEDWISRSNRLGTD